MALNIPALPLAQQVAAIYVAYYGRAPDPSGNGFWTDFQRQRLESGVPGQEVLVNVADRFADAQESLASYPFLETPTETGAAAFVDNVYQQLFNRAPEPEGRAFFTDLVLDRLAQDSRIGIVVLDILNGAGGKDRQTVEHKLAVAAAYPAAVEGASRSFENLRATIDPAGVINRVSADPNSRDSALALLEAVDGAVPDRIAGGNTVVAGTPVDGVSALDAKVGSTFVGFDGPAGLGVGGAARLVVRSDSFDHLILAGESSADGRVLVTGSDAALVAEGDNAAIQVGGAGDGRLQVEQGGTVRTLQFEVAEAGAGDVDVKGDGSRLVISPDRGTFTGDLADNGGILLVGDGGPASMSVTDGGSVFVRDGSGTTGASLIVAARESSDGTLTIAGMMSQLGVIAGGTPTVEIGQGGRGDLNLQAGASFVVQGEGGAFMALGRDGDGRFAIRDGAEARIEAGGGFPKLVLGVNEAGLGAATINGNGSELSVIVDQVTDEGPRSEIVVGERGAGTLDVLNGGRVAADNFFVGRDIAGSGDVTVSGSGSEIVVGADVSGGRTLIGLDAGEAGVLSGGEAVVEVRDGGTLDAGEPGDDRADILIGANGVLRVDDGQLTGDVDNSRGGTFDPGNSPGRATITGDFDHHGPMTFEIQGREPGQYDEIDVDGRMHLDGQVTVAFDYAPELGGGTRWDLLQASDGLAVSAGTTYNVTGLPGTAEAELAVTTTGLAVVVTDVA